MNAAFSVIGQIAGDVVDLIWPATCLGCGSRLTGRSRLICNDCLMSIPKVDYYRDDFNVVTDTFFREKVPLEYGCCFLQYKKGDWTQAMMHNIKYFHHPELGVALGRMAAAELIRYGRFAGVDCIVPIPMHPDKIRTRGFNQAERIAAGMSQVFGVPVREDVLLKTVNSKTQTFMTQEERIRNAHVLFSAHRVEECARCHFLVVDDVFTTGSTLLVCAQKLHDVMPECRVSVFALAKA